MPTSTSESETVNNEHNINAADALTWFIGPRPPRLRCCNCCWGCWPRICWPTLFIGWLALLMRTPPCIICCWGTTARVLFQPRFCWLLPWKGWLRCCCCCCCYEALGWGWFDVRLDTCVLVFVVRCSCWCVYSARVYSYKYICMQNVHTHTHK